MASAASGVPRMIGTICVVEVPVSSPAGARAGAKPLGKIRDMGALGVHAGDEIERGIDGAKHRRRQRGRVDHARRSD